MINLLTAAVAIACVQGQCFDTKSIISYSDGSAGCIVSTVDVWTHEIKRHGFVKMTCAQVNEEITRDKLKKTRKK